jgi:CheY-like chemotaxis protein
MRERRLGDGGREMKILVVDDDPVCRTVLVTALRMDRHEVMEAENGRRALEVLAVRPCTIDLLITDLMMPEMDGLALLRHLRSSPELEGVRVIVCSANVKIQGAIAGSDSRVAERLLKPIELRELRAAIERVAGGPRADSHTVAGRGEVPKPDPS